MGTRPLGGRKVFGIGFPRTGTTSLVTALNALGIKSIHNPARLLTDPDDAVLSEFDGFADNPLPLIYASLDRRFPGSKFILTDRDVDEWLASVEWMLSVGRRRGQWDANPRTVAMHAALYGSIDFRPAEFRERFLRHRSAVLTYFEGRPGDLLVVDFTRGDGWTELCAHLCVDPPNSKFPHDNRRHALYFMHGIERRLRRALTSLKVLRGRPS